ncbi:MAG: TlyA family RNA methyltransferase [Mycoplasmoidaceae bacterium]
MENKIRLDNFLVLNNYIDSRNKAQELIQNKKVLVNKNIITKNNFLVSLNDLIQIEDHDLYVSRAAYKLKYALDQWQINFHNKTVLDIGSSTGGFIQVALEYGSLKVYGIDVGTNQLDHSLKNNDAVVYFEKLNFKDFNKEMIKDTINFITCDVSFISCRKIIIKILELFCNNFQAIILLKPQFETEYYDVKNFNGLVKDQKVIEKIIKGFRDFCINNHIRWLAIIESPIKGAKLGNQEYLVHLEFNHGK